jgi:hypothetical protein
MKINSKALIVFMFFIISKTSVCLAAAQAQVNQVNNEQKSDETSAVAILQGLNKVTGKTSELRVKVGGKVSFGKLDVKVKKCWRAPLDQRPENKILLEIEEDDSRQDLDVINPQNVDNTNSNQKSDELKRTIFYGWMFSSSPSISGLEHPIYDITAIECKNN